MAGVFITYVTVWWKLGQFCNERERHDTRRARWLFPPRSCVNDRGYVSRATVVTAVRYERRGTERRGAFERSGVAKAPPCWCREGGDRLCAEASRRERPASPSRCGRGRCGPHPPWASPAELRPLLSPAFAEAFPTHGPR